MTIAPQSSSVAPLRRNKLSRRYEAEGGTRHAALFAIGIAVVTIAAVLIGIYA